MEITEHLLYIVILNLNYKLLRQTGSFLCGPAQTDKKRNECNFIIYVYNKNICIFEKT